MAFVRRTLGRRIFLALGLLALPAAMLPALKAGEVYRDHIVLRILSIAEYREHNPEFMSGRLVVNREVYRDISSEAEILRSESLARTVVGQLGEDCFFSGGSSGTGDLVSYYQDMIERALVWFHRKPELKRSAHGTEPHPILLREEAVETMIRATDIRISERENTITVTYTAHDAKLVQRVLSTLSRCYLSGRRTDREFRQVHHRLLNRADSLLARIGEIDREIAALDTLTRQREVRESRSALIRKFTSLRHRIDRNRAALNAAECRIRMLETRAETNRPKGPSMEAPVSTGKDGARWDLLGGHVKRAAALAESITLQRQYRTLEENLRQRSDADEKLKRLRRDRKIMEARYNGLSANLGKVRLAELLGSAPMAEVLRAPGSPVPVRHHRIMAAIRNATVMMGVVATCAFFADFLLRPAAAAKRTPREPSPYCSPALRGSPAMESEADSPAYSRSSVASSTKPAVRNDRRVHPGPAIRTHQSGWSAIDESDSDTSSHC